MKAIIVDTPGDASHLRLGEAPHPLESLAPEQRKALEDGAKGPHLLVRIHATALNRADILQREGKYPPPPGDSHILGLEMVCACLFVCVDELHYGPAMHADEDRFCRFSFYNRLD